MSVLELTGASIIAVGLLMMLFGVFVGFREARRAGTLGQASDFVDSIARLVSAIADARTSVILFAFGVILVFIGALVLVGQAVA